MSLFGLNVLMAHDPEQEGTESLEDALMEVGRRGETRTPAFEDSL